MLTDELCKAKKFGKSWFNEGSMMNVFSLAEMTDKCTVAFDALMVALVSSAFSAGFRAYKPFGNLLNQDVGMN